MNFGRKKNCHPAEMATEGKPEDFDGYFPDDGYDYTQHLRDIDPIRFVPATVKQAKKKPTHKSKELSDVMAALDADVESDEVDEAFRFNLGTIDHRTQLAMLWGEDQVDEYLNMPTERLMAIKERLDERERLAAEPETMGDAEFDEFFAREFGDEQIGGLSACAVDVSEESDCSENEKFSDFDEDLEPPPKLEDLEEIRAEGLEETKRFIAQHEELQRSVIYANDDDYIDLIAPVKNIPDWDCESVLSLRSNTCNHPGMIFRPPRDVRKKPGMTLVPVVQEEESVDAVEEVDTPVREVSTFRPKNETPEERKARKQAVKEFQRDQRSMKKKEENERKQSLNKAKMEAAYNRHVTFGDIRSGTSKFTI